MAPTGQCSVIWRSGNPRPERADGDLTIESLLCRNLIDEVAERECRARRAGRVTILATAIGNESFIDNNGNGFYDFGIDTFATDSSGYCSPNVPRSSASLTSGSPHLVACDDLPEAYLDKNENGQHDQGEFFSDISVRGEPKNNIHDTADGIYNGALCLNPAPDVCSNDVITIRQDIVIVMACNHPLLDLGGLPDQPSSITVAPGRAADTSANPPVAALPPGRTTFNVVLADCNGNGLPGGTTVSLNTSGLRNASASHSLPGAIPSSREGTGFSVTVNATGNEQPNGIFYINVTVPTIAGDMITSTRGIDVNP